MASVRVKFRPSTQEGREGTIYYQVIHNRVVRQIKTDHRIFADEWDDKSGTVIIASNSRSSILLSNKEQINRAVKRLNAIIDRLENSNSGFTADDIVREYWESIESQSFTRFMEGVIDRLKKLGKIRRSETYKASFNSFMRFREGKDVLLDEINSDLIMEYEYYLKARGVTMNTISFYMRNLRAVYNCAVMKGLSEQSRPFKDVYTGIDKTVKRAIPLEVIKKIKELDLSSSPTLDFARDMFLFSFYTRGMSFIDMAYLRKSDLKNGILSYRRKKTGQKLYIKWEACMQGIVEKHASKSMEYLLPIISDSSSRRRKQYENALRLVNHKLKQIAEILCLSVPLTTYVARHSWASIAKTKNIPLAVISEGMGHDSETTTQIYLASLDTSIIDRANELILNDL